MKRLLVVALTLAACTLWAEDPELGIDGPRIVGGDAHLAWGTWVLGFGAGYEDFSLGRAADGTPTAPPSEGSHDTHRDVWLPDAQVTFGPKVVEGPWTLWAWAGVRGYGDFGAGPAATGVFSDWTGGTYGFGQAGVDWSLRVKDDRGVVSGPLAEVFVEGSPQVLSVRPTSYLKASASASYLVNLWRSAADQPLIYATWGARVSGQYIDGAVPVPMLETTLVRGYHEYYDTRWRGVASTELRLGLPSLWNDHDVVPVVLAFADVGGYQGYALAPAADQNRSGLLAGAGFGAGLDLLGLATPTIQVGWPLLGRESDFWWTVFFSLRF